ncbi:FkbM family methyltransferase [Bradyrhizobium sp. F1.4.3]|uniref:FkbM family methyltransferase n=1 Tax=Bradyrhizobium sp. F1.4.3 TaxID=3156356 RepID=UPI003395FFFA
MKRSEYYSAAYRNLGLLHLLNFEYQKRMAHSAPFNLTSKKLIFPVRARPKTSDIFVFYQILVFDEYRCLSELRSPSLIVDLGANVGYSSAYFLSRFKHCSVVAVEPDPANFAALQGNLAPYGDRVTAIQAAVWPRVERLDLDRAGSGEEWGVRVKPSADGAVETVTIPDILKRSGQERISLLKIDIEGAEIDLFKSGTEDWLDRVDNIVIELHGHDAEEAFFEKIDRSRFAISRCDELTVCLTSDA